MARVGCQKSNTAVSQGDRRKSQPSLLGTPRRQIGVVGPVDVEVLHFGGQKCIVPRLPDLSPCSFLSALEIPFRFHHPTDGGLEAAVPLLVCLVVKSGTGTIR